MKAKVFHIKAIDGGTTSLDKELERQLNEWLEDNKDIQILKTNQTISATEEFRLPVVYITLTIFYE